MKCIRIANNIPYLAEEYVRSIQQQDESKNSRAGTEIDVIILFSVKSIFARSCKEMNIQNKHIVREKKQTKPKNKPTKPTKTKPPLLSKESKYRHPNHCKTTNFISDIKEQGEEMEISAFDS